jgi:hypothetical protein
MIKLLNCIIFKESFWLNPQFLVSITDVDENSSDNLCTMIIDLMQEDPRLTKNEKEAHYDNIMWALFKVTIKTILIY